MIALLNVVHKIVLMILIRSLRNNTLIAHGSVETDISWHSRVSIGKLAEQSCVEQSRVV